MACAPNKLVGICRSNKLVVDEETSRYLDLAVCGGNDDFHGMSHGSSKKNWEAQLEAAPGIMILSPLFIDAARYQRHSCAVTRDCPGPRHWFGLFYP